MLSLIFSSIVIHVYILQEKVSLTINLSDQKLIVTIMITLKKCIISN